MSRYGRYIMRPTGLTLIKPDSAVFNVTAKGGTSAQSYFDWQMAPPPLHRLAYFLNMIGFAVGVSLIVLNPHNNELILTGIF